MDGQTFVETEFYHVERLRSELAAWPELRALARDNGLSDVDTCEAARAYSRLRLEFEESYDGQPQHLSSDEPMAEPLPPSEEPVNKIMEGVNVLGFGPGALVGLKIWQGPGYATIKNCTGMLLSYKHVLTAAHCFPQDGHRPVTVTAISEDNVPFCMHPSSSSDCSEKPPSNAEGIQHHSYSGTGDSNNDFAVFVMGSPWSVYPYTTSATWARFAQVPIGAGHQLRQWGWGTWNHTGTAANLFPRVTQQENGVDWASSGHFYSFVVAGEGRACEGDSGGPAVSLNYNAAHPVIVGVFSNFSSLNGNCPNVGAKFRNGQVGNRDGWLTDVLESNGTTCHLSGHASNRYWWCW